MSNNAWEATSPTSLHPLMHFFHTIICYFAAYNDVGDVVSQALLLARLKYFIYCIRYIKVILTTYLAANIYVAKIVQGERRIKLALALLSRSLFYAKIVQGECRIKLALILLSRSLSYAKIDKAKQLNCMFSLKI